MDYEWSDEKNALNRQNHKIGFEAIEGFNWRHALIADRTRHSDGEQRFAAIGLMDGKFYTVIYTCREGRRRIISLRRSNKPEERAYEESI
jgi:uncharacterized protein